MEVPLFLSPNSTPPLAPVCTDCYNGITNFYLKGFLMARAILFFLLVTFVMAPVFAQADVTMVWKQLRQKSSMVVELADNNDMRVSMNADSALFVLQGKQYMASPRGGEWRVIDTAVMQAQMAGLQKRMVAMIKKRGGVMP